MKVLAPRSKSPRPGSVMVVGWGVTKQVGRLPKGWVWGARKSSAGQCPILHPHSHACCTPQGIDLDFQCANGLPRPGGRDPGLREMWEGVWG